LEGKPTDNKGSMQALLEKRPLISKPYTAITDRLIILVSVPVWSDQGDYLGFIGGTVYLRENNILENVLGKHPNDSSYVYVVDEDGNLIYHPDSKRIGENVYVNKVVMKVLGGENGEGEVINTLGIKMLAGYSFINSSGWGVISQTPKSEINQIIFSMVFDSLSFMVPLVIISVLLALWGIQSVVKPLRVLANYAQQIKNNQYVDKPKISDKYYEIHELKKTIFMAVDFFKDRLISLENEANIDPLTKLYNRRMLEHTLNKYKVARKKFSLILFDIDHFKSINDKYGHSVGDEVLIQIADIIKSNTKEKDKCIRYGGEEFLIILPDIELDEAGKISERIRKLVESSKSPIEENITISLGVSAYPITSNDINELLIKTDKALYASKESGRNRSTFAN
jgi:diguanylate cyclase (GGDEF)-like protein